MEREDMQKFANSVILLSKLLIKTEDRFFIQKLHEKISGMISAFVDYEKEKESSGNVAQRFHVAQYCRSDLLHSVNGILDHLEYLEHDSRSDATPLLAAQKNLLKFKLFILRQNKPKGSKGITSDTAPMSNALVSADVPALKANLKPKAARLALKSDSNKEKIYDFVKKSPEVRTKDILNKFNILSGRTVKRNLRELTDDGFLKRKSDGVAVYYLAAE